MSITSTILKGMEDRSISPELLKIMVESNKESEDMKEFRQMILFQNHNFDIITKADLWYLSI